MRIHLCLIAASMLCAAGHAHSAVTVGGRTFADNAFADAVTLPRVNYLLWDGTTANVVNNSTDAGTARAAMLDTPLTNPALSTSTFAACAIGQNEQACGTVVVAFTDNLIVNGPGADFTIFDINNPSDFKVTLNGVTVTRSTVLAGTTPRPSVLGTDPWNLNAADFDLSDFGLAAGATAAGFDLHWGLGETTATRGGVALIGAVNSVPEPGTWMLLLGGLAALTLMGRRRAGQLAAARQ
jgi:hypothetical protein